MKQVTQSEIAKAAKVSRSTVAMVLSENPQARISEMTRRRVLDAAKRLGYRPNFFAQTMRTGHTRTIGVMAFGGGAQLSYRKLTTAIQGVKKAGFRAMLQHVVVVGDRLNSCIDEVNQLLDSRVEGVLLVNAPVWFAECGFKELLASGIPVVSQGGCNLFGIPKYLSDKEKGFYLLTRHLLDQGYRRLELMIGWSSEPDKLQWEWHYNGACAGFNRAVREAGLSEKDASIFCLGRAKGGSDADYERGYAGMLKMIKRGNLPEVVLCSNDSVAIGALAACGEAGLSVPDDLAITGFEDEVQSAYGLVPLTTFAYPVQELIGLAVAHLIELIEEGKPMRDSLTTCCGHLVVRKSTAMKECRALPGNHLSIKSFSGGITAERTIKH